MRRLVLLVGLAGCYAEARGGADLAVRHASSTSSSPQAAAAIGFYGADDRQAGAFLLGVGVSPLVGGLPRLPSFSVGGRYERALRDADPRLRGFGRLTWAFSACRTDKTTDLADPACSGGAPRRGAGVTSVAFGVARTTSPPQKRGGMPTITTVGLALTYTFVDDSALGPADFFGLELSVGAGFDAGRVWDQLGR